MRVVLLIFVAALLWGQNTGLVINLRHISTDYAGQIAGAYGDGKVKFDMRSDARNFVVSGPPEILAIVESAIKRADVPTPPSPNIELIFYILAAGDATNGNPLPEDLAGVAKQVKGILGVAGLRMVESIQIRCREGRGGEASGLLGKSAGPPNLYQLRIKQVTAQGEANGRSLRLTDLRFGAKIASSPNYVDTGFNTDVDFKEGQKIVIGKSSLDTSGNPYFVVVTGKVVD